MKVALIVACSENGVIGKNNQLPWRLPADLKHFKALTMGKPVIMGRKTYESIGKALPGRRNLVVSRNPDFQAEGCEVMSGIGEAIRACEGQEEVFLIGGDSIYEKALDMNIVDRIYLTLVHGEFEGDAWFRIPEGKGWNRTHLERREADENNAWACTFMTLERGR